LNGERATGFHRLPSRLGILVACAALLLVVGMTVRASHGASRVGGVSDGTGVRSSPIKHVVILYQENHSFDNVLGRFCVSPPDGHQPCDGATSGLTHSGKRIPLRRQPDLVPSVGHQRSATIRAIDQGRMDGFDFVPSCSQALRYRCYTQSFRSQIPNLWALAGHFVVADRIFEDSPTPSWASHIVLVASTLDGFVGENPISATRFTTSAPNWGCDSRKDALWSNGHRTIEVPSCIPDQEGRGPYRASPVQYVPTIFDRLQAAGLTWKIYGGLGRRNGGPGWAWTICPTFYECLGSPQRRNLIDDTDILKAARSGTLPSLSIVTPRGGYSQHNGDLMTRGDNWIGAVVSALERSPEWRSTAIFLTYDDCGCFYDHVAPPWPRLGVRLPFVIVSPYARAGFTDPGVGSLASILAYVEHTFALAPLSENDAHAYDFSNSFDYSQRPLPGVPMKWTHIRAADRAYAAAHPPRRTDPT
jgi:phospholipase C